MAKMFKSIYGKPGPVEVEAEVPSYPHDDADGDTIYENTHFLGIKSAWKRHLAEHRAGIGIAVVRVKEVRTELARREKELCEASIFYEEALRAHDEFKGSK